MLIDFDLILLDIRDQPMKQEDPDRQQDDLDDLTLRAVCVGALLSMDQSCEGKEKFKRWGLAKRIQDTKGPVDLTVSELAKVRTLVGKAYGPIVVGQAWTHFDQMKEGESSKPKT